MAESFAFAPDVLLWKRKLSRLHTARPVDILRELLSNAYTALDKYGALHSGGLFIHQLDLGVKIIVDFANSALTIEDNGIGMSKEELVNNLVSPVGDKWHLFGLASRFGFLSAYVLAGKVCVVSKSSDKEQYIWESAVEDEVFTVRRDFEMCHGALEHGTKVICFLCDHWLHLLQGDLIEESAKQAMMASSIMSEGIKTQLYVVASTISVDLTWSRPFWKREPFHISDTEYQAFYSSFFGESHEALCVEHFKIEGQLDFTALFFVPCCQVRVVLFSYDEADLLGTNLSGEEVFRISQAEHLCKAGWLRNQIAEHMCVGSEDIKLLKGERCICDDESVKPDSLVSRVLIRLPSCAIHSYFRGKFVRTTSCDGFLPEWLNFVQGVVDFQDWDIFPGARGESSSGETEENPKVVRVMKKIIVKRILEKFNDLAKQQPEDYQRFFEWFGKQIKHGICTESVSRSKLATLLRFHSSASHHAMTSLADYLHRLREGQRYLYVHFGGSLTYMLACPVVQAFMEAGFEVLLMVDALDEHVIKSLNQSGGVQGKQFMQVSTQSLDEASLLCEADGHSVEQKDTPSWRQSHLLMRSV